MKLEEINNILNRIEQLTSYKAKFDPYDAAERDKAYEKLKRNFFDMSVKFTSNRSKGDLKDWIESTYVEYAVKAAVKCTLIELLENEVSGEWVEGKGDSDE